MFKRENHYGKVWWEKKFGERTIAFSRTKTGFYKCLITHEIVDRDYFCCIESPHELRADLRGLCLWARKHANDYIKPERRWTPPIVSYGSSVEWSGERESSPYMYDNYDRLARNERWKNDRAAK